MAPYRLMLLRCLLQPCFCHDKYNHAHHLEQDTKLAFSADFTTGGNVCVCVCSRWHLFGWQEGARQWPGEAALEAVIIQRPTEPKVLTTRHCCLRLPGL